MSNLFKIVSTLDDSYSTLDASSIGILTASTPKAERTSTGKWTREEVLCLLQLYKDHQDDLRDPKQKKRMVWEEISQKMIRQGYNYSSTKCEVKFKNLKQKYTKTVDHNNQTGNEHKTCSYYEEMEEIFALSPFVTPVSECSSMEGNKKPSASKTLAECPTKENEERAKPKEKKGKNEKKRKVDVIEVMREYQEEMKKKEEERMRKCEEMHTDKMRRFDRLLDLYEREISK